MKPVSIIIPCYNVDKYIEECISSALAQSYKNLEVICVDDGSTDSTLKTLYKIKENITLPFTIIEQTNRGASAARNEGLKKAKGEYIQFLDADDILKPEKISTQIKLATAANEPALIIGSYKVLSAENKILYKKQYKKDGENNWLNIMKTNLGITSSNLWSKSALISVDGWNENLKSSQEYDLMFRILKEKKDVAYSPEIHTSIRKRVSGAISQTNLAQNWERYIDLRVEMAKHIKENNISSVALQDCYQIIFDAIRILYKYDSESALRHYKKSLPKSFSPTSSETTSQAYILLFKMIGFNATEKIKKYLKILKKFTPLPLKPTPYTSNLYQK